jgi:Flp pilus assembly protein TadD
MCTAHCQSHIQIHKEVEHFGMVVNSDCLKDLDCIQVCPNDALSYGFKKPAGLKSLTWLKDNKKKYDFSTSEELLIISGFLVFVIIFRGLYDTIPILLAMGMAIILAWLMIIFIRLFRREFVKINNLPLKKSNRITEAGKWYVAGILFLLALTAHSAFIHYQVYAGEKQYEQLLALEKHSVPGTPEAKIVLDEALYHLNIADKWGLSTPASMNRELAAIYIYLDEKMKARDELERLLFQLPHDLEARLRFSKLLFVLHDENNSMQNLQSIVAAKNVVTDYDKKIRSDAYLMIGHLEEKNGYATEAESRYRKALLDYPQNREATLALGVLLVRSGKLKEAEGYLLESSGYFQNSPLIENNLGVIYMQQHQYKAALQHINALLALQPGNQQAQYNKALMLYGIGNTDEAVRLLHSILQENPGYDKAQEAMTMMFNKQHTSAVQSITQKSMAMH